MAKAPSADSRIPVFNNPNTVHTRERPFSRLSRPLATLSSKVRAHLTASESSKRQLFGILGPSKPPKATKFLQSPIVVSQSCPNSAPPSRPTGFVEPFDRSREPFGAHEKLDRSHVGRSVHVAGHKRAGVLRYLGRIELNPGTWCGVELDAPVGLNDGSVRGVRYFTCPPLHGLIVPLDKVSLADQFVSEVSESGPHSLMPAATMGEDWLREEPLPAPATGKSASQASTPTPGSTHSAGAPVWDWTIGSQHSSSAGSLVPSARPLSGSVPDRSQVSLHLSKHSSFEFDDSLGILTPDQMADFSAANLSSEVALPRTPSFDDVPFLIDLDYDKDNPRGSKRSSLDMRLDDTSCSKSQAVSEITITKRHGSVKEKCFTNDVTMKEPENVKEELPLINLMDQEVPKDSSEDTEMTDSNISKHTSAMTVSYEPSLETVSNSENLELIRFNRTPSLEDLPMDKDGKAEVLPGPSKNALPPPTSFVTSVTSIASLDNGYQGDGEWSRPASRGADHSPLASKVKTMDPMTDSDFFTESDADMHDENNGQAGSGTGRGDRKAQVIDGTLYGGVSGPAQNPTAGSAYAANQGNQRCPAFTPNTEEMDSSGIYSDLERKPEENNPPLENIDDENERDFSPEGSTRTGSSMKSDMSQMSLLCPAPFTNLLEQVHTIRNLAAGVAMDADTSEPMDGVFFHNSTNERDDRTAINEPTAKKRDDLPKKFKMPKRNVASKIKTMLTSNDSVKKQVDDENQENRRPLRVKKNGRWDEVMNKIERGKTEEKTKPSRLKEVKSKVFASLAVAPVAGPAKSPLQQTAAARRSTPTAGLGSVHAVSTRSLRDVTSLKSKSRRSRTRGSECSLPAGQSPSQASSRNSSLSDVSLSKTSPPPPPLPQSHRNSKKRDGRTSSPHSDSGGAPAHRPAAPDKGAAPAVANNATTLARPANQRNNGVVPEIRGSPRKAVQRRPLTATTVRSQTLGDVSRVAGSTAGANGKSDVGVVCLAPTPALVAQRSDAVAVAAASKELRHAAKGVEALGALVNYLVFNLDAFSTPQLKKDLDKMRTDLLNTRLQMEEVRASYQRSEEEKGTCERRLTEVQAELQAHALQNLTLTKNHEERLEELESRLKFKVEELSEKHTQEITCLKEEHRLELESEMARLRSEHQLELERLRTSVEDQLKEREKQLGEQLAAKEADYLDLKQQSANLLDSMCSSRDSKLQATANRCKMLSDEAASLRTVLELRITELQELRRSSEVAQRDAEQLPGTLQRCAVLQARVCDLEVQLERKIEAEQALAAEKAAMEMKVHLEDHKNKRLSQHNEELVWKLKRSSEVMTALTTSIDYTTPHKLMTSTPHLIPARLYSEVKNRNGLIGTHKNEVTPEMPKVVQKNESVSWVVDLDETPTNMASRLVRRANSMRTVQSAAPSPAHQARTLPNPHKRQRSKTTCASSHRARSLSFDSDSSEVPVPRKQAADWDTDYFSRDSTRPQSRSGSQGDESEELIVVETVGEDRLSFLDLERHIDREKLEVMGGEDYASPKLSSSSGSSEVSVRSRGETKQIDADDMLLINRVDGLISLPKESAGEAMISEEMSDNDSGTRDSDEEVERYCSEDVSLSGSTSELM